MTARKHLSIPVWPVGHVMPCGSFSRVVLSPDAREGTKELHHFSHLYLLLEAGGKPEAHLCRIIFIDEEGGCLLIYPALVRTSAPVFDIKPYFPVEDRVAQPVRPGGQDASFEWFSDYDGPAVDNLPVLPGIPASDVIAETEWVSTGTFRKQSRGGIIRFHEGQESMVKKLEGYSHAKVFWVFHRFLDKKYRRTCRVRPPYVNAPIVGVFASRSPVRPNPVAMTTTQLLFSDVDGREIGISGMDAFDNTPVLTVVPYIAVRERVKTFCVPSWATHWPEWFNEGNNTGRVLVNERKESHIAAIRNIIGHKEQPPVNTGFFWKNIDNSGQKETPADFIRVTGARQNNLKNVSLSIPKSRFTVITGMSGSGKSSLAFDTLYAESQRRFVDTLSTLGRQAFGNLERPDVEGISGLPYAIAIEQKSIGRNVRSTVGTVTEIFDFLRLLYSRIGKRRCPDCGEEIMPISPDELVDTITRLAAIKDFTIYEGKTGGPLLNIDEKTGTAQTDQGAGALRDKIVQALGKANHTIRIALEEGHEYILSSHPICPRCDRIFFQMTSSYFSPNHPDGMCQECRGLGVLYEVDPEKIVPRPDLSLLDGASPWWGDLRTAVKNPTMNWMRTETLALAQHLDINLEHPWKDLPEEFRRKALYGTGEEKLSYHYNSKTTGRSGVTRKPVYGAVNHIRRLFEDRSSNTAHATWSRFMVEKECPLCEGEKLSAEGRMALVDGLRYPEVARMSIGTFLKWVEELPAKLDHQSLSLAGDLLVEIRRRTLLLADVGLAYLSLDRSSPSLSGGEAQRIRLACQLGCGLNNLLYVLDEPSMGLHARDHERMLKTIGELRDGGNTVVVVEHDSQTMRAADFIIDMGPGAGFYGGEIVASGTPEEIIKHRSSLTGAYLSGRKKVLPESLKRTFIPYGWISVHGARKNNLKDISVSIPLGCITAVTGVSGSGKSSLVHHVLCPSIKEFLENRGHSHRFCRATEGMEEIDKVVMVDQSPIGRTPRSNPASYTGLWDGVRTLFSSTPEAKHRGYGANFFSFNNKEGACPVCQGDGRIRTEMHFMPDVWSACPQCRGKRFRPEILEISWNGRSVADILDMEIVSAETFFSGHKKVHHTLKTLTDVGLGYLRLGQSALDLSGGEAQRVKLARELCRPETGRTLYVLDEPTTGLHFEDIRKLLDLLFRLKNGGNTILFVEHNIDLITAADYVIDLGPEGGDEGGYVVAQGTVEEIMQTPSSHTGRYLRKEMFQ